MCQRHYINAWKQNRYRRTRLPIVCFVRDCTAPATRQGMCKPHYDWVRQAHMLATRPEVRADRARRAIAWCRANPERAEAHRTRWRRVNAWERVLALYCQAEARRAGYTCDFDDDYVRELWAAQGGICHWLGVPMVPSVVTRDPRRPSIDKLDPARGYTKGNVVLCTAFANMGRNSYPAKDFAVFASELRSQIANAKSAASDSSASLTETGRE